MASDREDRQTVQDRPFRRELRRALAGCFLLIGLYFLIPVEPGVSGPRLVLRGIATALGVLVVARLVLGKVNRAVSGRATDRTSDLLRLAYALVAGLIIFALADYVIAVSQPDQFVGLRTKVDALYFALATLTTIGYGDVHAEGQLARITVCLQMLFSIGVLATGVSTLFKRLTDRPPPPARPRRPR